MIDIFVWLLYKNQEIGFICTIFVIYAMAKEVKNDY